MLTQIITCHSQIIRGQNEMIVKSQRVKDLFENLIEDVKPQVRKKYEELQKC